MKKLTFLTLLSLLGIQAMAQSGDTDISSLANVVYINPLTAAAGSQQNVSVCMKNTVGIQTVQFDLVLPQQEDIRVALDDEGFELIELSLARTTKRKMDSFGVTTISEGHYRVVINSTGGFTFDGNDGEIATAVINVGNTVTPGDYPVLIKDIVLVDQSSNGFETEVVKTTMKVTAAGDTRTILDENSTVMPVDEANARVTVKRTIKADEWSTIVLPFEMTPEQWKSAFGPDAVLMDFNGYEVEEDDAEDIVGILVNFKEVASTAVFKANHPYVLKVSSPISEFDVDGVDIVVEEEPVVAAVKRSRRQWSELIGTYVSNTIVPENTLFITQNKFWYSKGATRMMAFRAYFDFYDILTKVENPSAVKAVLDFNDQTTEIKDFVFSPEGSVYSVQGVYYGNDVDMGRLPKGVYIINGKKIQIK